MAVRSELLYGGTMAAGTIDYFTTPAGFTTILKFVTAHHQGNVSALTISLRSGGVQLAILRRFDLASNVTQWWEPWIVIPEGFSIRMASDAGTPANVSVTLSGAVLLGT